MSKHDKRPVAPQKPAEPRISNIDVQNLVAAARKGLSQMAGADLINVSISIANAEALFTQAKAPAAEPAKPEVKPNG